MKVTHVVTYVSEDGAYGGPVAVATAQARMLASAGHEVELLGGSDGTRLSIEGCSVNLRRAVRIGTGFFGVAAPAVWWRSLQTARARVFHLHLGRDLVGLPTGILLRILGAKYVVQTHGMVRPDRRLAARLVDLILTRPVLRGAAHWLVLDGNDESALSEVVTPAHGQVVRVFNTLEHLGSVDDLRDSGVPTVVFASRLHPRKNVLTFARAASSLARRGFDARFEVWGPDEGDLAALLEIIEDDASEALKYRGAFRPGTAIDVLARADVFVLPSHGEVFPMSVLEAIAAGAAVVAPSDCPMAMTLAREDAALVTDCSQPDVERLVEKLLLDASRRRELARNALRVLESKWSRDALLSRLEECYR